MAMRAKDQLIGVDVSKADLEIAQCRSSGGTEVIPNNLKSIRRWLKSLVGRACIAVEATNTFHLALVEEAHAQGHIVYLIDGLRLNRYRESVGGRAKTDRTDAQLLLRYLEREHADLRPWSPPPPGYTKLQRLMRRRAVLVEARTQLRQSFREMPELKRTTAALMRRLDALDRMICKHIQDLARETPIAAHYARCQAIEGVGPLTAAALANTFRRGAFRSSDAFIAFMGLDVRVRESGTYRGRRKLTKKGDPEIRRLLHNAAMAAKKTERWRPFYEAQLQRGMSPVQVLVILARKLARIAFALMKNESEYVPALT